MSDPYYMKIRGSCLAPVYPDGTTVVVHPTADIVPLSLCHVVLLAGTDSARAMREIGLALGVDDGETAVAKFFLDLGIRGGREILLLGQLCPAAIAVIPIDDVAAMHLIDGLEKPSDDAWETASEALDLIAWARGDEASKPINPAWRPAPVEKAA